MLFMKNHFDMVFTSQIRVFHGRPISSILCIIDVSLFVQHICIYVFYIYIHIYMYVYLYLDLYLYLYLYKLFLYLYPYLQKTQEAPRATQKAPRTTQDHP